MKRNPVATIAEIPTAARQSNLHTVWYETDCVASLEYAGKASFEQLRKRLILKLD
ncbi:hypothetical protein [Pedobacter kyungheensis]|uniref:hypothetical protein n=1 Tax=Pedobacter kyungheensis TaxID=1069985 RepID=UPI0012E00BFC|nr:hypothetical protein [Pedobacter kyungheensis]